jgi:hypothetical protein
VTDPEKVAVELASRAADLALCLDFDGTLAPIVNDPDQARPLSGVVDLLGALAGRFAAVALLSGRPAAYRPTGLGLTGLAYPRRVGSTPSSRLERVDLSNHPSTRSFTYARGRTPTSDQRSSDRG